MLRADPRFERSGGGRGSRWRLVLPPASSWDGLGRDSRAGSVSDDGAAVIDRLAALERRVAELERDRAYRAGRS